MVVIVNRHKRSSSGTPIIVIKKSLQIAHSAQKANRTKEQMCHHHYIRLIFNMSYTQCAHKCRIYLHISYLSKLIMISPHKQAQVHTNSKPLFSFCSFRVHHVCVAHEMRSMSRNHRRTNGRGECAALCKWRGWTKNGEVTSSIMDDSRKERKPGTGVSAEQRRVHTHTENYKPRQAISMIVYAKLATDNRYNIA